MVSLQGPKALCLIWREWLQGLGVELMPSKQEALWEPKVLGLIQQGQLQGLGVGTEKHRMP